MGFHIDYIISIVFYILFGSQNCSQELQTMQCTMLRLRSTHAATSDNSSNATAPHPSTLDQHFTIQEYLPNSVCSNSLIPFLLTAPLWRLHEDPREMVRLLLRALKIIPTAP